MKSTLPDLGVELLSLQDLFPDHLSGKYVTRVMVSRSESRDLGFGYLVVMLKL